MTNTTCYNTLSDDLAARLEKYPQTLAAIKRDKNKPMIPVNYRPSRVEVYCDGKLAHQEIAGQIIYSVEVDRNYSPVVIEWAYDGELVYALLDGKRIFNRLYE